MAVEKSVSRISVAQKSTSGLATNGHTETHSGKDNIALDRNRRLQYSVQPCRNIPWLILFIVLAILPPIAVAGIYGRESLDRILDEWQVEGVLILAVSFLSAAYSHIWLLLLRRLGGKLLVIAAVGAIILVAASSGLSFASGEPIYGSFAAVIAIVSSVFLVYRRSRLSFAKAALLVSCQSLQQPAVPKVSLAVSMIQAVWFCVWAFALSSLLLSDSATLAGLCMLFCLYWTTTVVSNVSRVAASGFAAAWWIRPNEATATSRPAIDRACTTLLGSICQWSILYGPLSRLKLLALACQPNSNAAAQSLCAPHVLSHMAVYAESLPETRTQMLGLFAETQFDPVVRIELCSEVLTMIRIGNGMLCSVLAQLCGMMFTLQSPLVFIFIAFLAGYSISGGSFSVLYGALSSAFMLWAADPQMLNDNHPLQMKVLCSGAMVILGEATPAVARPILKQALRGGAAAGLNNLRAGAAANKYVIHPESPSASALAAMSSSPSNTTGLGLDARGRVIPTSRLPRDQQLKLLEQAAANTTNNTSLSSNAATAAASGNVRSRYSNGLPAGTQAALAARGNANTNNSNVNNHNDTPDLTPESLKGGSHLVPPSTTASGSSSASGRGDTSPSSNMRSPPQHAWGATTPTIQVTTVNNNGEEVSPNPSPRLRVQLPVTPSTGDTTALNSTTASDIALASRTPAHYDHTPHNNDHIIDMTLSVPSSTTHVGGTTLMIPTPSSITHINNNGGIALTPVTPSAVSHPTSAPPPLQRASSTVTIHNTVPVPQVLTLRADTIDSVTGGTASATSTPTNAAVSAAATPTAAGVAAVTTGSTSGASSPANVAARMSSAGHQRQNSSPRLPKPLLPVTPVRMLLRRGAPSYHALYRSQSNLHQRKDSMSVSLDAAPGTTATTST